MVSFFSNNQIKYILNKIHNYNNIIIVENSLLKKFKNNIEKNYNNTKVIIICKKHGNFEQTPANHLSKYGCTKCGIELMKMKQRTEIKDFVKKSNIIHNNK
jgi:hypothetical protein